MTRFPAPRDATAAVPYPLRVAAAVSWRLIAVALVLYVVVDFVIGPLRPVVVPVAIAILLTALLGPVVTWFVERRVPRGIAVAVVLLGAIATLGALLVYVVQTFVDSIPELSAQLRGSVGTIQEFLEDPPFGLPGYDAQNIVDQATTWLNNNRARITSGAVSTATTTATTVGSVLTSIVLVLFTLIYLLANGAGIWRFLIGIVPREQRGRVDVAGQRAFASLVGFIRATVFVAVVDAVGIGIGLWAVGNSLWVPLTALVFLTAFIPVVGAVASGIVAVLVTLVAVGWVQALIVLGVVLVVQQLEGNVLQPLILGRAVRLDGLAVVLAVAAGTVVAGITGALLSVPILAAVSAGVRSLLSDEDARADPSDVDAADPDDAAPESVDPDEPFVDQVGAGELADGSRSGGGSAADRAVDDATVADRAVDSAVADRAVDDGPPGGGPAR